MVCRYCMKPVGPISWTNFPNLTSYYLLFILMLGILSRSHTLCLSLPLHCLSVCLSPKISPIWLASHMLDSWTQFMAASLHNMVRE